MSDPITHPAAIQLRGENTLQIAHTAILQVNQEALVRQQKIFILR